MGLSSFLMRGAKRFLAGLLAMLVLASCGPREAAGPVVLAPSSMQETLGLVAMEWERQGHASPVLSFAATNALARQIEQGAPADIVICADQEWMDWLAQRDLILAETRRVLAGNALALVSATPAKDDRSIAARVRSSGNGRIALADPASVPAGRYAQAALENMGLWADVKDRIVPAENVRAALTLVEAGEASLGIVYATDASASRRVYNAQIFDFQYVPEIVYPAAQTGNSRHVETLAFLAFLSGPEAHAIYAKQGFSLYEPAP